MVTSTMYISTEVLCGFISSAEATRVDHTLSNLHPLPGVSDGCPQYPGLPPAGEVHRGE